MKSFLSEVAATLYERYGQDISSLTIVFPNRRGSRFFARELSAIITQPTWQPTFSSIDDLLRSYTGMQPAHTLTLTAQLYNIYKKHLPRTKESFDQFFSWGQLLIADFDTIDKYMIDARLLYANIEQLQELDNLLGDDYPEKQLIMRFWKTIRGHKSRSKHSATFLDIWDKMYDIYTDFNTLLREQNIGYSGMIYRQAATMIANTSQKMGDGTHYVFVGFNALNRCEQVILDALQKNKQATFFWDTDQYYLKRKSQEAGHFLRYNTAHFNNNDHIPPSHFTGDKHIEVVKSPTDIMQCKALYHYLEELHKKQGAIDCETAIILTDENLLPAVLYSIPSQITDINITMGAPLNQSPPYVFFERLSTLQRNRTPDGYLYQDTLALLEHPFVANNIDQTQINTLSDTITKTQQLYVKAELFKESEPLKMLFPAKALTARELNSYYAKTVEQLCTLSDGSHRALENNEYTMALLDNFRQAEQIMLEAEIRISVGVYHSLLGQINSSTRIPFEGQPLKGLQIMGILESRCLDFKNVFVLSMCDETFPGNRSSNSYIPPNLRRGFGLPTPADHAAVWAYYFYRLIQRAQNVTLMYSSSRDGGTASGEPSRYIYQLEYESPHHIHHTGVDLHITPQQTPKQIAIPKTKTMVAGLHKLRFSPSAINSYIDCPLQFYLSRVAKIRHTETPQTEISAADTGSILHKTIEKIYLPILGKTLTPKILHDLLKDSQTIDAAIDTAAQAVLQGRLQATTIRNNLEHLRFLLHQYVKSIIEFDAQSDDLQRIDHLEQATETYINVDDQKVCIHGIADRVDGLVNGAKRIVDYKSGTVDMAFASVESLFSNIDPTSEQTKYARHNGAALQTLIYAMGIPEGVPAILPLKMINDENFSPYITNKSTGDMLVQFDPLINAELEQQLEKLFREMFDPTTPFRQTQCSETCKYCDYIGVCERENEIIES